MAIEKVALFGATGFQGRAQLQELVRQGYRVRAINRDPGKLSGEAYRGAEPFAADYNDKGSIKAALDGIDAVFFQAPALGDNKRLLGQCSGLADAIRKANIQLTVVNSSMWAPDQPCGEIIYDGVLAMEQVFETAGIPVIMFRPTLFMNNLLGDWVRSSLVDKGVYHYPHKADMRADWISLEDLAKFMVAALSRPDLAGRKFRIGGPERLTTLEMLSIVGGAVGRDIRYEYMTPRDFGEYFWNFFGEGSGLERATYVDGWDSFYTFNNDAPQRPFQADSSEVLALFPIERTSLLSWAQSQNWYAE